MYRRMTRGKAKSQLLGKRQQNPRRMPCSLAAHAPPSIDARSGGPATRRGRSRSPAAASLRKDPCGARSRRCGSRRLTAAGDRPASRAAYSCRSRWTQQDEPLSRRQRMEIFSSTVRRRSLRATRIFKDGAAHGIASAAHSTAARRRTTHSRSPRACAHHDGASVRTSNTTKSNDSIALAPAIKAHAAGESHGRRRSRAPAGRQPASSQTAHRNSRRPQQQQGTGHAEQSNHHIAVSAMVPTAS